MLLPFSQAWLMNWLRRPIAFGLALLGAAAVPIAVSYNAATSAPLQQAADACYVVINGAVDPEMLPTHHVWEAIFQESSVAPTSNPLELGVGRRARLATIGAATLERVAALRRSLVNAPSPGVIVQANRDRNSVVSETILNARDEFQREMTSAEFAAFGERLHKLAETLSVKLPLAGQVKARASGEPAICEVTVDGGDAPEFIPEHKVWEVFFETWAVGANKNRAGGAFDVFYLDTVRRILRIPAADAGIVMERAIIATAALEVIKGQPAGAPVPGKLPFHEDVQQLVMAERHHLSGSLSAEGWRALTQYVEQTKIGFKWWYRSTL